MSDSVDKKAAIRSDIENRLTYQRPKGDQPQRYEEIRRKFRELALYVSEATPISREQALALTKLEESVMWANASIARNE